MFWWELEQAVSVLFNEPKLLKSILCSLYPLYHRRFSALQRAEIAEISSRLGAAGAWCGFSALQRAEIAEMVKYRGYFRLNLEVSVLFNEPKLLK